MSSSGYPQTLVVVPCGEGGSHCLVLCAADPSRQCWEIEVWDLDSFSALRSCAASQGQLKQWVKAIKALKPVLLPSK